MSSVIQTLDELYRRLEKAEDKKQCLRLLHMTSLQLYRHKNTITAHTHMRFKQLAHQIIAKSKKLS